MPYNNMTNNYQSSKYIVDADGTTPFTTIQSAIDQVVSDGILSAVLIEIRPGTYVENLVLEPNVSLTGCSEAISNVLNNPIAPVMVIGTHTPPITGQVAFSNLFFIGNTDVLLSAAAGAAAIGFNNCVFSCNGFAANLTNWTGDVTFQNCSELPSVVNGIFNNSAGASLDIINSQLGAGFTSMSVAGPTRISFSKIYCPMTFNGAAGIQIDESIIDSTIFVLSTAQLVMNNSYIISGSSSAISTESSVYVALNNVVIDSSATTIPYVLDTPSTGFISIGEVVFVDEATINPAVTVGHASTVQTGGLIVDGPMSAPLVYASPVGGTNQMMVMDNTGLVGTAPVPGGSGFTWYPAPNDSGIAVNSGYYNTKAGALLTLTLPGLAAAGTTIIVQGTEAGNFGWLLAQNAGQNVQLFAVSTTIGVGGSLASTNNNDTVTLLCTVADTTWNAVCSGGNITVV